MQHLKLSLAAALLGLGQAATAQMSAPPLVSALPDVSSMSAANAAGVTQYCVDNSLVSSAAADGVLARLRAIRGLTKSPEYLAGRTGRIIAGAKDFSLPAASPFLKSQGCDLVFKQARRLP